MQCRQERKGGKGKSHAITGQEPRAYIRNITGQEPRVYIRNLNLNHAYMHANEFQKCGQGSARMKRNTNAKTFKDIPMHPRWIAAKAPNKLNIARRYCNSFIILLIWPLRILPRQGLSFGARFQNSRIPDYHVPTFLHFQIPRFPHYQIPAGTDGRSLRSQPDLSANA